MGTDRGVPLIGAVLLIGVIAFLALASGAFYVSTTSSLGQESGTLTGLSADVDVAQDELARLATEQEQLDESLAVERVGVGNAEAKLVRLNVVIGRQQACVARYAANIEELNGLIDRQRANSQRVTSDSKWGRASKAADAALDKSVARLRDAYTHALNGRYATANTMISASNAQLDIAGRHFATIRAEVKAINRESAAVDAAYDAVYNTLNETATDCGG